MATLQDLQTRAATLLATVQAEPAGLASVKALITGQTQLLIELRAQLAEAAKNADPAKLAELAEMLDVIIATAATNADALAAAAVSAPTA